jgi:hypothetical protein
MITTRIDVAGNWLGTFQGWNDSTEMIGYRYPLDTLIIPTLEGSKPVASYIYTGGYTRHSQYDLFPNHFLNAIGPSQNNLSC